MCGRFSLFADDEELVSLFDIDLLLGEHAPSWNEAPSQRIRVVMDRVVADDPHNPAPAHPGDPGGQGGAPSPMTVVGGDPTAPAHATHVERQLRLLEWGLVPSWAKPPLRPVINARAETLTTKPSFRAAAAKRRCLVPANGYFEWQAVAGTRGKQPWFLSQGDGDPVMAFAGIYEAWRDAAGGDDAPWLLTCAIVTRFAPDALGEIHDRMPVVVPPGSWDAWLDPDLNERARVEDLLRSLPAPALMPRRVGRAVGNVRNDGPELIDPVE